ncbi:hypothetical protein ACPOL_6725 [Acidisarcina polymorpha]|uniref:Uncharacterized protein n=1 Tax=Acidisarcina polymorpha TaxID=2211140 RepID=A0A2Z5GAN9_9BACT|nr:hypothetical protein ACPOL_6725 [Acidisarcina polymorpha]
MVAPVVAVGLIGPVEVRHGEGRDLVGDSQLLGGRVESPDGRADHGEQAALDRKLGGMGVEVPDTGKEDLPADAQRGSDLNHLRNLLKLRSERSVVRKLSLESGRLQGGGQNSIVFIGIGGDVVVGLDERNAALKTKDLLGSGLSGSAHGGGLGALTRLYASRNHRNRRSGRAVAEQGVPVTGGDHRNLPVRIVDGGHVVGDAAGPAGGRRPRLRIVLPLQLLVGMREQAARRKRLRGQVLGAGQRLHQGADVGHDRGLSIIEERLNVGQIRIEGVVRQGRQRQQRVLGKRQGAANFRIAGIVGGVEGDDGIVGVISPEQEDADERLVVGGALSESVHHAEGT